MNDSARRSIPAGPSPPASRLRSPSQRLMWRCVPLPVSLSTRGANDTFHPCRFATARTVSRTRMATSAAATGSRGAIDSSNWPSAYSGWNCCRSRPCASIVCDQVERELVVRDERDVAVAGPLVRGLESVVAARRPHRELELVRGRAPKTEGAEPAHHALQEPARTRGERLALLGVLVDRRPGPAGHRRQRQRSPPGRLAAAGRPTARRCSRDGARSGRSTSRR